MSILQPVIPQYSRVATIHAEGGEEPLLSRQNHRGIHVIWLPYRKFIDGMIIHVHLALHLDIKESERRYRTAFKPREWDWWQIVYLVVCSQMASAIAPSNC